jgi:seryl-tRNA synthetase
MSIAPSLEAPDADVVWQSLAMPRPSRIDFADVERAGLATAMGDGCYAASGPLARLLARFDNRVLAMAVEGFDAVENHYPALIPTDVLHKAGYFDSFPQFLMAAGRFHPDSALATGADAHHGFTAEFEASEDRAKFMDSRTEHAGHCLSPTVCYHTYQQFAGREVPHEGSIVTATGKIFRFEGPAARTMERLWDFTMREVVFLGSRETVMQLRQRMLDAACQWVDELRLAAHVEVANDPFFGNAATNGAGPKQVMVQRALKLKYELQMPVVEDRYIAVGSFNIHGQKFGKAFGITTPDGEPAYSGCIGIGLERIAYAFLCRHGIDPADWPQV